MLRRRVLFDLLAASTGGQLTRARAFLSRFRAHDPDSRMWVLQEGRALGDIADHGAVEFISIATPPRAKALYRSLWQNTRLPRLAQDLGIDVYLSFSHYLPARLPDGILSVVGVANLAPFSDQAMRAEATLAGRLRLKLLRTRIISSSRRASRVIALSNTCRDILVNEGVPPARISVIPNGVELPPSASPDDRRMASLREKFRISARFLLYVSHFYPYKNFERLIQAYALLDSEIQSQIPLVLVGAPHDRRYFASVRDEVHRCGLSDRVIVIPGLDGPDLSVLYRDATLFVYPSLIENSPNILLEAMIHGCPVIAGNNPPMPEFGGSAIRYFDPLSPSSMAIAISDCLAHPQQLLEMKASGPLRASTYSWDDFTRKVVDLYRSGAEGPAGGRT